MRQIAPLDLGGLRLIGTYHSPENGSELPLEQMDVRASAEGRPAVVILNFGDLRRSGPSDLCARLADGLAGGGFATFRFDLPGLGDTPGDLPPHQETYWNYIERGGVVSVTSALLEQVWRRYSPSKLILAGFCGGAVTAIQLAAKPHRVRLDGLMLFEPTTLIDEADPLERMPGEFVAPWTALAAATRNLIRAAWTKARCTPAFAPVVNACRGMRREASKPKPASARINERLLAAWGALRETHTPILLVMATGPDAAFNRKALLPHGPDESMTFIEIGTNHLFTSGGGGAILIEQSVGWMQTMFAPNSTFVEAYGSTPATAELQSPR